MAAELIGASQHIFAKSSEVAAPAPAVRGSGGWSRWLRPAFAIPVMAGLLLIVGYQNLLLIQSSVHRTPFELNAAFLLAWGPAVYPWAVTAAKTSMITLPASADIGAAVKSYRQSFLEPRDPLEAGNSDGKKLHDALIAPAEKRATATRFLSSQPEKFTYLHFATHGTASRLRPLESAVILSPEGESYKLYARDVLKHPLTAYLVTISACNGGRDEILRRRRPGRPFLGVAPRRGSQRDRGVVGGQ